MKKVILISVIIAIFVFGIYQGFLKKEEPSFDLVEVIQGELFQEISETGMVKKGNGLELGFKNSGRLEKIYVEVGDEVKSGQYIAKIETSQLQIQVQEAKANLTIFQSKLNKLLAGASQEEIQITETKIAIAEISFANAEQNLKDVQADAEQDLKSANEDALNVLDDCYLKSYNAFNSVDLIQRTYFSGNDQDSIRVKENKNKIEQAVETDTDLSQMKKNLEIISDALKIIREICEEPSYRSIVSSTDKTSLDNQRTYISTGLTNITDTQQTISSTITTNESLLNTAQAQVSSAEGSLQTSQDEQALLIALPREQDIDLYQAQVKQAQAKVNLLEDQIAEAILKSPIKGQITKVNKKPGELVQLTDIVLILLPSVPFEIETDIYEEDVVKINIGNPVDISLIAFPNKIFTGKVISIDPAEKLVEGVVYYRIIIAFEEIPEGVKPGMTADLIIKTAKKENVLMIDEEAIQKKDDKVFVEVLKDGEIEEREIETGLLGSDDMLEIISGLIIGEKVILR